MNSFVTKYLSCLYESVYVVLKHIMNRDDALEAVASSVGFSLEANIKSRGWLLCGQSDIDYYLPKFNKGINACWSKLSYDEFLYLLKNKENLPIIIETEPLFVPYYENIGLGLGLTHAMVICEYNIYTDEIKIYDKLASDSRIQRDKEGFFWFKLDSFYKSFNHKLFKLDLLIEPTNKSWKDEVKILLKESISNMNKKVDRERINFQAFGFEALEVLSNTIRYFDSNYHDDALSIWLFTKRIPINISQSVIGNRAVLYKNIKHAFKDNMSTSIFNELFLSFEEAIQQWKILKEAFISAGNNNILYEKVADEIDRVKFFEIKLLDKIEVVYEYLNE